MTNTTMPPVIRSEASVMPNILKIRLPATLTTAMMAKASKRLLAAMAFLVARSSPLVMPMNVAVLEIGFMMAK